MAMRWLTCMGLAGVLVWTACGGEAPEREKVPPPAESYTAEEATGPGSPASQRITVVNPLDRPLILTARVGGEEQMLGTIDGDVEAGFFVQAEPGTRVELVARDSVGEYTAESAVVLQDAVDNRWVIGEGTSGAER